MWAEREKGHYPCQAQQDGETGHRPQVPQRHAAVLRWLVDLHPPDLDQDQDEYTHVAQQDEGNEGHHRHVEEDIVLQPAAGGTQIFRSSLCVLLQCYFFDCEIISRRWSCVYLQLLVYAMYGCEHCRQRVSIGVFIYSQNQADYEQGNTCCSKIKKKKTNLRHTKGLVKAWRGAPNGPQSSYPILRRKVWACRKKHRSWRSWPVLGTCGRLPGPSRWRRPGESNGARPPWRCTGRSRRRTRAKSWARTSCSNPEGRLIGWWGSSTGSPDAPSCDGWPGRKSKAAQLLSWDFNASEYLLNCNGKNGNLSCGPAKHHYK